MTTGQQSTVLFLRSFLPRAKFEEALSWVKSRERRLWLPDSKLWAYDTETNSSDPAWGYVIDEVKEAGWTIVGSTDIDAEAPLRSVASDLEFHAKKAVRDSDAERRRY